MVYVHVPSESPRAQELVKRLRATIEDYQAREAKLTQADIELALRTILPSAPASRRRTTLLGFATALGGLSVAGALAALVSAKESGSGIPIIIVAVAAVVAVVALLLLMRARSD
jgi:hypothetical protein